MSKEYLEALGKNIRYKKEYIGNDTYRLYIKKNEIELLENYLTELEQIKEANPSEALKCLDTIKEQDCYEDNSIGTIYYDEVNTIKQALLKAQEMEKVLNEALKLNGEWAEELDDKNEILSIIKEKEVNIQVFNQCEDVETYNKVYIKQKDRQLTQEEFDTLKRWLDEKNNNRNQGI